MAGSWHPARVTGAVARRARGLRNELRARSLPLHTYRPEPELVVPATAVAAAPVPAIDAHNHLGRWLNGGRWLVPDVGALVAAMDELNVATIVNLDGRWDGELDANLDRYDRAHPGRFATFCHLDWSVLTEPDPGPRLRRQLRRAAEAGAAGVKVWKDLGLSVRDGTGALVTPDDPRLDEAWETAGELGLPVLVHTADPVAYWRPVDARNERFEELARHPEWSQAGKDVPRHGELLDALERLVAAHRGTTFIGAHVGNCAEDLSRVGKMLTEHPNLVVDLGAREAELGRQPRAARALVLEHPERVLFGSDAFPFTAQRFHTWFRLLGTADEHFPYSAEPVPPQGRWAVSGLDLPADVLGAVYAGNARRVLSRAGTGGAAEGAGASR